MQMQLFRNSHLMWGKRKLYHVGRNERFGFLTTLRVVPKTRNKWVCRCSCGKCVEVYACNLVSGNKKSCGCNSRIGAPTHGHSAERTKSRTYQSWQHMLSRCRSKTDDSYPRYGGAGIRVCKRWLKFENFLADMGERPFGKSIDRLNGSKLYSKSRCRWATPAEQARNSKAAKLKQIDIPKIKRLFGKQSSSAVGEKFGVSNHAILDIWNGVSWV